MIAKRQIPFASACREITPLSQRVLQKENVVYLHTGGRSQENRHASFVPAFFDRETDEIFLSRFAGGGLAPVHILDGLPTHCILKRDLSGHVVAVKSSIISGFYRQDRFYTREQAANCAATN